MGLVHNPAKFEDDDGDVYMSPPPSVSRSPTPTRTSSLGSKGKSMATNTPTTRVVTGVVRGSYCNLFKAVLPKTAKEGDTPKFGMTILIPKTDTETYKKLKSAQEAAIAAKWAKRPPKIDSTLHDGDEPRPSTGEAFGDECKGHYVMSVNSKFKPKVIDRDSNEVIDPSAAGSGDYFKVSINAYAYEVSGKRGVSFGLNNVLFWDQGESLAGTSRAEDDFADDLAS